MTQTDTDDLTPLSGLQLEVLRAIWKRGEASTADVAAELALSRDLAHTTVGTLLSRLEKRGLIRSRRDGKHLIYRATVAESEIKRSMVSEFLDRLFGGDAKALVAHLVSEQEVKAADLNAVRQLLRDRESGHE